MTSRTHQPDFEYIIRGSLLTRLLVVIASLLWINLGLKVGRSSPLNLLLVIVLAYDFLVFLYYRYRPLLSLSAFYALMSVIDIALIGLASLFSGGVRSFINLLFVVLLVNIAVKTSIKRASALALEALLFLILSLILDFSLLNLRIFCYEILFCVAMMVSLKTSVDFKR